MIGSHEGKELTLMLKGEKPLAVFGDIVPPTGQIAEEIIPEKIFAPYVASGVLVRTQKDISTENGLMRYVCFALPEESWRISAYLWMRESILKGKMPYDNACDIIIGRLLGYSEADIKSFVQL